MEFKSVDEAMEFLAPEWFSEDISEKTEYRNKILSKKDH